MDSNEHREIGEVAFGRGLVNLGGDTPSEAFQVSFGDVMALSGDYFAPEPRSGRTVDGAAQPVDDLFTLARISGARGTQPGTRDEVVCALKVISVDEASPDCRFELGGQFAEFRFSRFAASSEVERRVRDRYLKLAATNDDHFLSPGGITRERGAGTPTPAGSARLAYRHLHQLALEDACRLGRHGEDESLALAREAAAQHFLTDALTAGHVRTPVAAIRRYWLSRYPTFWENLQRKVAADTAAKLRELARPVALLPSAILGKSTLATLERRTAGYPQLSLGDFLARLFHDWDNRHGVAIEGGGLVFGDGHVQQGVTRDLALAASRAGIEDVEAAFALGASQTPLTGEALYQAVRAATGAPDHAFLAETRIPRPSPANPAQNWRAPDLETLWDTPIVGSAGTTVGEALVDMMSPDGYFIRQLDRLGRGLARPHGLLALPVLGRLLIAKGSQAYHEGFVEPLAAAPEQLILSVLHDPAPSPATVTGPARDASRRATCSRPAPW